MDSKTATTIYQTMILPFLTNCTFATYGATANDLKERNDRIEKWASRKIWKEVSDTIQIRIKRICSFVQKCLYDEVCEPFQCYFKLKEQNLPFAITWQLLFHVSSWNQLGIAFTCKVPWLSIIFQRNFRKKNIIQNLKH